MILIIQLETTKYCFGYHYEHPFNGRQKFDGQIGELGSACPQNMTKVESVFLTTKQQNISVEAQINVVGSGNKSATLIGLFDKSARIVSSSVTYTDTAQSNECNIAAIVGYQTAVPLKATHLNISLSITHAKNLAGLVSEQKAEFSLNYVNFRGTVNCSNASSLLVATQAQPITARQLQTQITMTAPQAAGLVLEQTAQLTISNARMTITVESSDLEKGSAAISVEQREPTTITNSEITATLKGKECAAVAVTQSGVLTITQTTITATVSEAKNASGLVVRQSAVITLDTVTVHATINVEERAAGFVVEQRAALTATNCQINGTITSQQLAAGVVHIQAGALTITQLQMQLTITAGADPASLIYSAENTISLDTITGTVNLDAKNKMVGELISISTESFQVTKFNSVTVSISGLNDPTVMCPCFAPHKCFKTPTLRQYCGHPNTDFDSPNQLTNWTLVFNSSTYDPDIQFRAQNLTYVKSFTNCGDNPACPDVNNSILNYNFKTDATNRSSNLVFSNFELATFYLRDLFYNIIINADDMHLAGKNGGETLLGGLATTVATNTKVINCHLIGNIRYNPNLTSSQSQLTIGGFIARQNCDKLEFIYCTVDGSVKAYHNAGGFLGRQDKGNSFFTSCVSKTTGYKGQAMSFFIGIQNSNSSTFENCSANGVFGFDGLRGAFVGNATENAKTIIIKNSNWTSQNLDVQYATGSKATSVTVTTENVRRNDQIWKPGMP